jgi:hypothetical protein
MQLTKLNDSAVTRYTFHCDTDFTSWCFPFCIIKTLCEDGYFLRYCIVLSGRYRQRFWDIASCCPVDTDRGSRRACHLYHHGGGASRLLQNVGHVTPRVATFILVVMTTQSVSHLQYTNLHETAVKTNTGPQIVTSATFCIATCSSWYTWYKSLWVPYKLAFKWKNSTMNS